MDGAKKKKVIIITIIVLSVLLVAALTCLIIVLISGNKTATSTVPDNIISTEDPNGSSDTTDDTTETVPPVELTFSSDQEVNTETVTLSKVTPGYKREMLYYALFHHGDDLKFHFDADALNATDSKLANALMLKVEILDLDNTIIFYDSLHAFGDELPVELTADEGSVTKVEFRVTIYLSEQASNIYADETLDVAFTWRVDNVSDLVAEDVDKTPEIPDEKGGFPVWLTMLLCIIGGAVLTIAIVLIVYFSIKKREKRMKELGL